MSKFILGLLIGLLIRVRIERRPRLVQKIEWSTRSLYDMTNTKPVTEGPTLRKDTTRQEFDVLVKQIHRLLNRSNLSTDKKKVRADMLARFASLHGVTPKQAEKLLDR